MSEAMSEYPKIVFQGERVRVVRTGPKQVEIKPGRMICISWADQLVAEALSVDAMGEPQWRMFEMPRPALEEIERRGMAGQEV